MGRLVLGLDIGVTSVGYGVIDIDNNEFVDYGVRLFKEGSAENNEKRRERRGSRRLIRRRQTRLEDMKHLLKEIGIMDDSYQSCNNVYEVRAKGLSEKLSNNELCAAILHITKHRGSSLETVDDDSEGTGSKSILSKNSALLAEGKYICEVQLERLNNGESIRGIDNNFKTIDYEKELTQILSNQGLSDEDNQSILDLFQRRREYYEGPGSEKSPTPYGRFIEVDGEIQEINLIEKMIGKCSIYPDELRAPKLSYSAELFNLLNDLNNLTINGNQKITYEEKQEIIDFINKKGNITVKQVLKILNQNEVDVTGFRINKNGKPIITEFKGYKAILKVFKDHNSVALLDDKDMIDYIYEVLTRTKGVEERKQKISDKYTFNESLLEDIVYMQNVSGYHSLSLKALRELNIELMNTEMNQMQILQSSGLFNKNRKSTKGQKNILADDEAILSPVAKRAHRETFKVINKLRKIYGEFDSIVIETTRDKNTSEQKKRINDMQKRYENENKSIEKLLKAENYDIESLHLNGKTRNKIRLYMQQDGKSAYTLQPLDLRKIIFNPEAYEIDHIIPISVSLDDSLSNKVLVTREENQLKGQNTPIQAYLLGKFKDSGCNLNTYKTYVKNMKNINAKKRSYLLCEDDITKFDVIQKFINRNLVDTSYACRSVMNTLQNYFKDNEIPTKVHTIKGSATHAFRTRIKLDKERDEDYYHHAIDALIVASLKKLDLINSYLMKVDFDQIYNEETGEIYPVKDDNAYLDDKYISFVANLKNIYRESVQYSFGYITRQDMHYQPIKISHKVDTKPNRQIANETIYSTRIVGDEEKLVEKYKDIYEPKFDKLTNDIINGNTDKYIMAHKDPQTFKIISDIILNHFNEFNASKEYYVKDSKGKYALKGTNPLAVYKDEFGKIKKYSKKGNGPEITSIKYYSEKLGNHCDITSKYTNDELTTHNKHIILKQISPYRTDFYVSPEGKYNFVTVRYNNVFYSKTKQKYIIDKVWYEDQKLNKKIDDTWTFVCSMHHDELIGIVKNPGQKYIYDESTERGGETRYYDGHTVEILKFTATNDDKKGTFEVKPINNYCKKQLMPTVSTCILIKKFATDVLGNMYEVKENVLKFEFD
ncbi:MAG: type II CRISPR RNA-guided endonuclease Cas9 [Erysipelotrichaceae bacterium]|nr:type II CRISPR RNA-guided endonuclease Cas9 [Erysipelotrichaceae bacterium]